MIIMQELIHTMSLKKGNLGNMAIKIDLEKAYNRLEWHFNCDILILYNLPMDTSNLIMRYVSRSFIYILFNGGKNYSWAHFFLFDIWNFWLQRNKRLFQSTQPNLNLCKVVEMQVYEYWFCILDHAGPRTSSTIAVGWVKPPLNWVKLNTYGFALGNPKLVGGGGIIRDCNGNWYLDLPGLLASHLALLLSSRL